MVGEVDEEDGRSKARDRDERNMGIQLAMLRR
jgi:hypothetical protein